MFTSCSIAVHQVVGGRGRCRINVEQFTLCSLYVQVQSLLYEQSDGGHRGGSAVGWYMNTARVRNNFCNIWCNCMEVDLSESITSRRQYIIVEHGKVVESRSYINVPYLK